MPHEFVINIQGTAFCTCRGWVLWNCSETLAEKNHRHHVNALPKGINKKERQ
jgi:hypothetical protein